MAEGFPWHVIRSQGGSQPQSTESCRSALSGFPWLGSMTRVRRGCHDRPGRSLRRHEPALDRRAANSRQRGDLECRRAPDTPGRQIASSRSGTPAPSWLCPTPRERPEFRCSSDRVCCRSFRSPPQVRRHAREHRSQIRGAPRLCPGSLTILIGDVL